MRVLVTGSAGHLGDALGRTLRDHGHEVVGIDLRDGSSITDRACVRRTIAGVQSVLHTATLHKPHVVTHERQQFVDTNITGTLILLEEAVRAGVASFIFTSTTSVFPATGWITEDMPPAPKNIYGVTKRAAEDLCELFHRRERLPCLILRTSRFFPEADDDRAVREVYEDDNVKVNEYLYRRVDIEDAVSAHLQAIERAPVIGFGRYVVSATTPFSPADLPELRTNAPRVVRRYVPEYEAVYARLGWKMTPSIDRVYVNAKARAELGWRPRHDFRSLIECLATGGDSRSPLARLVGSKGYHAQTFADGPYPVG
ncbi:MAG TPA: NAD(P)-dependent oxidoreductase [Gemmatimonadaceae bacterium]|nr:NAD(P)-dependent oxidoreductase [Gemmatimonadaceae bacterium]